MKTWIITSWLTIRRWVSTVRGTTAYRTEYVSELPDDIRPHRLYAIGTSSPWSVAMLCPCGCQTVIQLSLLKQDKPRWKLTTNRKKAPTLSPSVHRTSGCCAHFFLREGKVVWCE